MRLVSLTSLVLAAAIPANPSLTHSSTDWQAGGSGLTPTQSLAHQLVDPIRVQEYDDNINKLRQIHKEVSDSVYLHPAAEQELAQAEFDYRGQIFHAQTLAARLYNTAVHNQDMMLSTVDPASDKARLIREYHSEFIAQVDSDYNRVARIATDQFHSFGPPPYSKHPN